MDTKTNNWLHRYWDPKIMLKRKTALEMVNWKGTLVTMDEKKEIVFLK